MITDDVARRVLGNPGHADRIADTLGLLRKVDDHLRLRLIHCAINRRGGDVAHGRGARHDTELDFELRRDRQVVQDAARRVFRVGRNLLATRHIRRRFPHLIHRDLEDEWA